MTAEPLWTAADVAKFMAVDKRTIQRWAAAGSMPAVLVGPKLWRFEPDAVRAWLAVRRTSKI